MKPPHDKTSPTMQTMFRSIMTVRRVARRSSGAIVTVQMAQWHSMQDVCFPLRAVPKELRPWVKPGALLFADVNIEAECAEDLRFSNFSLPSEDVIAQAKAMCGPVVTGKP